MRASTVRFGRYSIGCVGPSAAVGAWRPPNTSSDPSVAWYAMLEPYASGTPRSRARNLLRFRPFPDLVLIAEVRAEQQRALAVRVVRHRMPMARSGPGRRRDRQPTCPVPLPGVAEHGLGQGRVNRHPHRHDDSLAPHALGHRRLAATNRTSRIGQRRPFPGRGPHVGVVVVGDPQARRVTAKAHDPIALDVVGEGRGGVSPRSRRQARVVGRAIPRMHGRITGGGDSELHGHAALLAAAGGSVGVGAGVAAS